MIIKLQKLEQLINSELSSKIHSSSINNQELLIEISENNLVDENTLTYVAIHELAHLATEEIGHIQVFWDNFRSLLEIATEHGLYNYVDYSLKPQPYCGLVISSNVLNS